MKPPSAILGRSNILFCFSGCEIEYIRAVVNTEGRRTQYYYTVLTYELIFGRFIVYYNL
jgi:hypothetical protein